MGLKSKTILTTRASAQSGALRSRLEAAGAKVIECPTIEIVPVEDWSAVDEAIQKLDTYEWLLFTSTNAVDHFMRRIEHLGIRCDLKVAVVGTSTAKRLEGWQLKPAIIPTEFRAEGLLRALPADLSGSSILFPRAETAPDLLPIELRRRGARVDVVTVYRTVGASTAGDKFKDALIAETIDCIVFTSPSTIHYLSDALDVPLPTLIKGIPVAVIGPITRHTAEACGLSVGIVPVRSTIDDLVGAIEMALCEDPRGTRP